jgi:hypothetical protein
LGCFNGQLTVIVAGVEKIQLSIKTGSSFFPGFSVFQKIYQKFGIKPCKKLSQSVYSNRTDETMKTITKIFHNYAILIHKYYDRRPCKWQAATSNCLALYYAKLNLRTLFVHLYVSSEFNFHFQMTSFDGNENETPLIDANGESG